MNTQAQNLRKAAEALFEELHKKAHGDKMKARVKGVHDACSAIVNRNGVPNAKNIVEWIATNRPAALLPEQTIYNKRNGGSSPYLMMIQAWATVAASMTSGKTVEGKRGLETSGGDELVTEEDLRSIPDLVVRHKIALLKGQYEGIRNQIEIRQAIKDKPPVAGFLSGIGEERNAADNDLALTEEELEALGDFLNTRSASRYGIEFDDFGAVVIRRTQLGARISKPGFVDAIRKIVTSYGADLLLA